MFRFENTLLQIFCRGAATTAFRRDALKKTAARKSVECVFIVKTHREKVLC